MSDSPVTTLPQALVIRTGNHRGARSSLSIGSILVGSARHCDLILSDPGIAPEQLLLTVAQNQIRLHNLGDPITVAGQALATGASVSLNPGNDLTIGSVQLELVQVSNSVKDELSSDQPDATNPMVISPPERKHSFAALAVIGVLGIAGLLLGYYVATSSDGVAIAGQLSAEQRYNQLAERVEKLGLPELKVKLDEEGHLNLTGYVHTQKELQAVRAAAGHLKPRTRVFVAAELVRFAQDLARARGFDVSVQYFHDGVLRLTGQDDVKRTLERLANAMPAEIPGVNRVQQIIKPAASQVVAKPTPTKPEPYVLSGVNGINSGDRVPYISSGNSFIFPGGVLKNGMSVIAIEDKRVIVDDRGRRRTTEIQVQ